LFGDTVNTASRMESTGIPDRIQISEETACELRKYGYDDWFVPREDEVAAKGKGVLQTYWLGGVNPEMVVIQEEPATFDADDDDLTDISNGSETQQKRRGANTMSNLYRNFVSSELDITSC
jgi:Adenylate and Guanylate cyclase catalytic domain